ncbi:hypothetical protein FACJOVSR_CDS0045 [Staphylococcus phage PG-2021_67]
MSPPLPATTVIIVVTNFNISVFLADVSDSILPKVSSLTSILCCSFITSISLCLIIVDNSLTLPFKSLTLEFKVLVSLLFKSKLLSSFPRRVLIFSLSSVIFSFIFLTSSLILEFILWSDFSKSNFVA